ncbi:MAG TPA: hypothetical protein VIB82_03865 [Caulobacteraceae bacterium]
MSGEKYLSGTYNSGYTLSSIFSILDVTSSGVVNGTNSPTYAPGGDAVVIGSVAELLNHGTLAGGAGGGGMPVGGKFAAPPGYAGGAGANLTAGGTVANYASITGGAGGHGGVGYGGGAGGSGGYGVRVAGPGTVTNAGKVSGGQGGFGGSGHFPGHGGTGGTGIVLTGAGSVGNTGTVVGGAGGGGVGEEYSAGAGGTGGTALALNTAGTATNSGLLQGGAGGLGGSSSAGFGATGGLGGFGLYLAAGGVVTNNGSLLGGVGGTGGNTGLTNYTNYMHYYFYGADGGQGGAGCRLGSGGTVINTAVIAGGLGGTGGSGSKPNYYGNQGALGDGIYLAKGGVVTNGSAMVTTAKISGRFGVEAGTGGKATVTNFGSIGGYYAGLLLDGGGVVTNGSKTDTTAAIDGITLAGVGTVTNFGSIGGFGVVAQGADRVVSFGYIGGIGGFSVQFTTAGGRLVAENGARFGRGALGGGGILELAGGSDTITGLGVTGTITGGVTLPCEGFGTYQFDATTTVTFTGANALAAGHKLIDTGHLNLTSGASLTLGNGGLMEIKGAVANAGTIALSGATSVTELIALSPGVTLSGGGTINLAGPKAGILGQTATTVLTNADNTISGTGFVGGGRLTLVNQLHGVIEATAGSLVVDTKGSTLTNGGQMLAFGAGGLLVIESTTIDQTGGGIIAAGTGGAVRLQDDVIDGGFLTGTSHIDINIAGGELNGVSQSVTIAGLVRVLNGANEILAGSIANGGTLEVLGGAKVTDLIIGAAGATLGGKGTVMLSASADNRIYGQALGDTLTNVDNLIEGSGQLGNGVMKLVNRAGGKIIGNQTVALTINTVSNTITNAGLIENSGSGGTLVDSAVVNTGTLMAAVIGTLTLSGLVTGAGVGVVNGGTLDVVQAFSENVTFTGTTGVFELGHSVSYKGKVTGLSTTGTSSLDLSDITFTSGVTKATFSGTTTSGTLTVTDGTHTAKITLLGNYLGHAFKTASDGHGGTTVIDPKAATTLPMVQAIAGLASSPPPSADAATAYWPSAPPPTLLSRA